MARIHYLGTCSGTEPMPNMHHCSLVLEVGGIYYWFDAGENCAHRALTSGMDLTKVRAIFVSHPHLDHTGGLANLLACMRKLVWRYKTPLVNNNSLDVYFPEPDVMEAVKTLACGRAVNNNKFVYTLNTHGVSDGLLYEDENVRVTALHNRHLGEDGSNGWHSYSFLIEYEGRRLIFSGDLAEPCEIDPLVQPGDYLIMETGHHAVKDVCEYAISRGAAALRFNHHGREILGDRPAAEKLVSDYAASANISIKLCYDGMIEVV